MWVIMKTLTFGQMSKMYSFLTTSMKTKISRHFVPASVAAVAEGYAAI